MPWIVANLGTAFPGMAGAIEDINNAVDAFQSQADKAKQYADSLYSTANDAVNATQTIISSLAATGFYILMLEPGPEGSWSTRMMTADGAPPDDGFNCGFVVLFHAASPNSVIQAYNNLLEALNTSIKIPKASLPGI